MEKSGAETKGTEPALYLQVQELPQMKETTSTRCNLYAIVFKEYDVLWQLKTMPEVQ